MKKFHNIYSAIVMNLGRDGASRAQMAARLKTSRQQLTGWARAHPKFAQALEKADDLSLCYWEQKAQDYLWQRPSIKRARTRRTRDRLALRYLKEGQMILSELVPRFPRDYGAKQGASVASVVATGAVSRVIMRAAD